MRVQARITLPEQVRASIDAARERWNPELASNNPAHVTVVYHDEAPNADLLQSRLAHACRSLSEFPLLLGSVERFSAPDSGAFIGVIDPSGGARRLRELVLSPPFEARARFGLHVTLLHPAYGFRLSQAWPDLCSIRAPASFAVERIDLVAGVGPTTITLSSCRLGSVGAVYV